MTAKRGGIIKFDIGSPTATRPCKKPPQAVNSPAIYGGVKVYEICFSPFQRAYYQQALAVCLDRSQWLKPIAEKDVKTPFWDYNNSYPAVNDGANDRETREEQRLSAF